MADRIIDCVMCDGIGYTTHAPRGASMRSWTDCTGCGGHKRVACMEDVFDLVQRIVEDYHHPDGVRTDAVDVLRELRQEFDTLLKF